MRLLLDTHLLLWAVAVRAGVFATRGRRKPPPEAGEFATPLPQAPSAWRGRAAADGDVVAH